MDSLALIQTDVAARLNSDAWFTDITVLEERKGDIQSNIDRALGGLVAKASKIGTFIVVAAVVARVSSADAPGPHFDDTEFIVTVLENPTLNNGATGTEKAAIDTAARVCQVLHHYRPEGIAQTLYCDRQAIEPDAPPKDGWIAYRCRIRAAANLQADAKVVTPAISPDGQAAPQTVTITCATSGAAIYYTTDDSYPWSGNAGATLYSAPFNQAAAASIRAVAYKVNMIPSDSALANVT